MKKSILIIGLVILFVGASVISSGLGITKNTEEKPDEEPCDTPYTYHFAFAKMYTSDDFEAIGMVKTGIPNTLSIWIEDGLEYGELQTGILNGKLYLDTARYGVIDIGPGCSIVFDYDLSGDISISDTGKILWSRITKIDGYGGNILVISPDPIPESHSKQLFIHPIFALLQRILQRPLFNFR